VSFGGAAGTGGGDGDEWVETHAGRAPGGFGAPGTIDDIPDLDGDDGPSTITTGMSGMSVGGATSGGGGQGAPVVADIPDMDEIPDMEEDLEVVDDEAAAPSSSGVIQARLDLLDIKSWACC
jgi:ubiquitin-like-conjugating enzyme ATG3